MKERYPWIVMNTCHGGRFECRRCGQHYAMAMPAPVDLMVGASRSFERSHKGCVLKPEGLHCIHCGKTGHGDLACPTLNVKTYDEWWHGTDRGQSSMTIWCVMTGNLTRMSIHERSEPCDPSDFGRCSRLLARFPEWRERMGEMASLRGWERLAPAWDDLEALYAEEIKNVSGNAPKLYARMQQLRGVAR